MSWDELEERLRRDIDRRSRVIWVPEHPTFALIAIIAGIVIYTALVFLGAPR